MSDLVGAFLLQARIVKPSRLTEVPAAVRALDDAIFQKIKGDGSCPAKAQRAIDQFIKSRAVMGGAQLTGIALLACMREALGVSKMNDREIQRKCAREGRFDEETLTAKDWNDALTDLNVDMCSTQPSPEMSELIAIEVNEEIKRLGRKVKGAKFADAFEVFTKSQGTQFQKLQRFQAAIALWFKEEIKWKRDDLIVALKTLEQPMTQRFLDADVSARANFIRDEGTNRWVFRDGCDPGAAMKQLMSSDPTSFTTDQNIMQHKSDDKIFVGSTMPPTVQVLKHYGEYSSASGKDKHKQILETLARNQAQNEANAAATTAKLTQKMADVTAKTTATEEALATLIMSNRKSSNTNLLAKLSNDTDNDHFRRTTPTRSSNYDSFDDRMQNTDNYRRLRDDSGARSATPPLRRNVPRNSYDELDSHSHFIGQGNSHHTVTNTRRNESPTQCPPCFPQGHNDFRQIPFVPNSFVRTNTQSPRSVQRSQQTSAALASQSLNNKASVGSSEGLRYASLMKNHYLKGDIDDEDVQMQIRGTAYVVRQLQREHLMTEQEDIFDVCWQSVLAWHGLTDDNGIKYQRCGGGPPDGKCKMDHRNPGGYNEIHLKLMKMGFDYAQRKKQQGFDHARREKQQAYYEYTQDQAVTGDDEEWWKYCHYCGQNGHTTRTCDDNPYWNSRCSTCYMVGHISTNCRSSDATIAKGLARKDRDEAEGAGALNTY